MPVEFLLTSYRQDLLVQTASPSNLKKIQKNIYNKMMLNVTDTSQDWLIYLFIYLNQHLIQRMGFM